MHVRIFKPDDAEAVVPLFRDTVRRVNIRDYAPEQVTAWAPDQIDVERWRQRLLASHTLIAEQDGQVVGFINLEATGHLDCLFVHADHQGEGVGRALLTGLEDHAKEQQIVRLFTEASITARPFFERHGFTVIEQQTVELRGVLFVNFRMEKLLNAK